MDFDYNVTPGYLNSALSPKTQPVIVKQAYDFLRRRKHQFDAIAVRGVSGMIIGSPVAYKLNMPLVIVRKSDGNHSGRAVEGLINVKRYVIVDDMVASGETVRTMRQELNSYSGAEMIGLLLYYQYNIGDFHIRWNCWVKSVGVSDMFHKKPK